MNRKHLFLIAFILAAFSCSKEEAADSTDKAQLMATFLRDYGKLLEVKGYIVDDQNVKVVESNHIKALCFPILKSSISGRSKVGVNEMVVSYFTEDGQPIADYVLISDGGSLDVDVRSYSGTLHQLGLIDFLSASDNTNTRSAIYYTDEGLTIAIDDGGVLFVEYPQLLPADGSPQGLPIDEGDPVDRCNGYKDVLFCTGYKFEKNAGTLEEILGCYVNFPICYVLRQIDCILAGCPHYG